MSASLDLPGNALVAMTRDSLPALRAALFRDVGPNAAAMLQEAGYAGGQAMFDAFSGLARGARSAGTGVARGGRFRSRARPSSSATPAGARSSSVRLESVATVDSGDWAEGNPAFPLEFPGCYYTSGVMADFFGRLAGEPVAVMEVECRSMGGRSLPVPGRERRDAAARVRRDGARRRVRAGGGVGALVRHPERSTDDSIIDSLSTPRRRADSAAARRR